MSWQILVGLSVLLYSINALLHRVLMKDTKSDAYAQTIVFNGLTGIFSLLILLLNPNFHFSFLPVDQFIIFIPVVICVSIATICAFKGLKFIEASEHTILLTTSKIWVIIGAFLVLREDFVVLKCIGAIVLLIGVFITEWRNRKFALNIGALYILIAAFLYATGEILSFYILRNYDALSFMIYTSFLCFIALIVIKPQSMKKLSFYLQPKFGFNILTVSFNDTLATLFVYLAYQAGRNALQIGPLMATQTIVTVLLAILILKETDHIFQKICGTILVVTGSILLVL